MATPQPLEIEIINTETRDEDPVPIDRLILFDEALARARLEATTIPTTDRNDHGGYDYSSAEAVFRGTTSPLARAGLTYRPILREITGSGASGTLIRSVYRLSGFGVREDDVLVMPIGESKKPFQNRFLVAQTVCDREAVARLLGVARRGEPNPEDNEVTEAAAPRPAQARADHAPEPRRTRPPDSGKVIRDLSDKMTMTAKAKPDPTDPGLTLVQSQVAELSSLSSKYGREFCALWTEGLSRRSIRDRNKMIVAIKSGVSFGLGPDADNPGPYTLDNYWDLLAGLQSQSPEEADACTLETLFGDVDTPWDTLGPDKITEACLVVRRKMILARLRSEA